MCRGLVEMSEDDKEKIRKKIIEHTQDFLDKGFKIKKIPISESAGESKRDYVIGRNPKKNKGAGSFRTKTWKK